MVYNFVKVMKAIVKVEHTKSFQLKEVVEPTITTPDGVKLKMVYSGICGTDVHIYNSDQWAKTNIKTPHVNGHEGVGQIVETGDQVKDFAVGDFVSFETHIYCNECRVCQMGNYHVCKKMTILGVSRDGVWSEFVVMPEKVLFKLTGGLDLKYAAVLEPFGNAYHTQSYSNLVGKNVLVTGDGPIGLFAALIARVKGAKRLFITGINKKREEIAKNCDLHYINPLNVDLEKELDLLTDGEGIDVVLESSGSDLALKQSINLLNECGEINIISLYKKEVLTLHLNAMIFKNLRVQLVTGRKMWSTWNESYALLKSGKIPLKMLDNIITHFLPFQEFEKGFGEILKGNAGKILLSFDKKK